MNSNQNVLLGDKEYFKNVPKIEFEGPESDNPYAFKYYNPEKEVAGYKMRDFFKFAIAYWHSFCNPLGDPFGVGTRPMPWNENDDPYKRIEQRMDAAFEFFTKLGVDYFCFHDIDLVDEPDSLKEFEKRLDHIIPYAKEKMDQSGMKVLWGTANLFNHPRYMNGAGTSPDFPVVARTAAQIKNALDTTIALNGENYVFWGGREGYYTLLNTAMQREREHFATLLHKAKDYARAQGFEGTFFIEPKPMEPTKHQYDYDTSTVLNFIREFDLQDDFMINVEVNHAELSGHTFQHELQTAVDAGLLGSIDGNRGDHQNGWDTDQFAMNIQDLTEAMLVLLDNEVKLPGGINFDAKLRRNSTDLEDLFTAHIGSMDAIARSLLIAEDILKDSPYPDMRRKRYTSFDSGDGKKFEQGNLELTDLHKIAHDQGDDLPLNSGKQERYEQILFEKLK